MTDKPNKKVAIIGGGVAGMAAAYRLVLQKGFAITLYEKTALVGGDTFGVPVYAWDGSLHRVDGGVSDFNQSTFKEFNFFLEMLPVKKKLIRRETGFMDEKKHLIYFVTDSGKATFWQDISGQDKLQDEIYKFKKESCEVLDQEHYAEYSVDRYLQEKGYSEEFWKYYFRPRALGCFLMHRDSIREFPIRSLVAFWRMHSIVGPEPPQRTSLVGGMVDYCPKFQEWFLSQGGALYLNTDIESVISLQGKVKVGGNSKGKDFLTEFDEVVLATKPRDAQKVLAEATDEETGILSQVPYAQDHVVIHSDSGVLPRSKRAWGAYNLRIAPEGEESSGPTITFWQNNLAILDARLPDVFMTLNPRDKIDPYLIIEERTMTHPVGTFEALLGKGELDSIQGKRGIWFCGSYTKMPFLHEDAFCSGLGVADSILKKYGP